MSQLGDDRIVRIVVRRAAPDGGNDAVFYLYIRLWSNAANFIVTGEDGVVLDAMRRLPKRGEITGGRLPEHLLKKLSDYSPENKNEKNKAVREYEIRELPGEGSFNKKIDAFYAASLGPLSLEALREQARMIFEGSIGKIGAALERLREKEAAFEDAPRFKEYGDLILSNIANINPGDKWLEIEDESGLIRIELEPRLSPATIAGNYYEKYRKAKSGLAEIQREIADGEQELKELDEKLNQLLREENPYLLLKLLKSSGFSSRPSARSPLSGKSKKEKSRPGLTFKRGDWIIIVGRDAKENDELLRRHVKGNDLWLHARDYHGSYVFIRQRSGKSFPLDIMLDAGNLALFYSKGRNNGEGDLFYTPAKYLRRAKDGPKGLVIPTQEKNLHIKLDEKRLRILEGCKL